MLVVSGGIHGNLVGVVKGITCITGIDTGTIHKTMIHNDT
jgi:hypothetical protein